MADQGSSNIDEIAAALDRTIASVDFTRPGAEGSLAADMIGAVARGIADRSVPDAEGPAGDAWLDNRDPYRSWKAKKYDAHQPGVLTGQMLSLESLKGEPEIAPAEITMRYGTGRPADRARNGAPPPAEKNPPTDRQKAAWFTDGGREFYALDDRIGAAVTRLVDDALGTIIGGF